jgi:biotin synthase-like enzyme
MKKDEALEVAGWLERNVEHPAHLYAAKKLRELHNANEILLQAVHHFSQVADKTREDCAKTCEQAGMDGYGTLAAAEIIRKRGKE